MKLTLAAPLLFLEMLCGQSSGTWHQIGQTIPRLPVESVLIADPANEATVYVSNSVLARPNREKDSILMPARDSK